jgi:hypothetical protein
MDEKMTPEQEQKIAELDAELTASGLALPYFVPERNSSVHRRILLHKFLLARQWNIPKAMEMIRAAVEFRTSRGLDTRPLFPAPQGLIKGYDEAVLASMASNRPARQRDDVDVYLAAMQTSYSGCYHKFDRANRPVWIERTGMIDTRRLVDTLTRCVKPGQDYKTPAVEVHLLANEIWSELIEHQRMVTKDPNICQSTLIMDCAGLGMSQIYKPALAVLQAISTMDQKYYPEGMYKLFLTNCPRTVSIALGLVKPWLDVRVQQKIIMLKPHELSRLHAEIDPANLPEFLGGTCNCPGGCVALPTGEMPQEHNDAASTEKVVVPAGQVTMKYITMTKGNTTSWEFTTEQRSIGFGATFGAANTTVVEYTKLERVEEPVSGFYSAEEDGVLTLKFDNSFSWMTGKTVLLRVETI